MKYSSSPVFQLLKVCIILMLLQLPIQYTIANELATDSSQPLLHIPSNSVYSPLLSKFKDIRSSVFKVLSNALESDSYVPTSTLVLNVHSGYGDYVSQLFQSIGEKGEVISFSCLTCPNQPRDVDVDTTYSKLLLKNYENSGFWGRSLLLDHHPCSDFNYDRAQESKANLDDVYNKVHTYRCPKLLQISESEFISSRLMSALWPDNTMENDVYDVYCGLTGGIHIIKQCQPIIYIELNHIHLSKPVIELLTELGYRIYWHISWLVDPLTYANAQSNSNNDNLPQNKFTIGLLAVNKAVDNGSYSSSMGHGSVFPYEMGKFSLHQYPAAFEFLHAYPSPAHTNEFLLGRAYENNILSVQLGALYGGDGGTVLLVDPSHHRPLPSPTLPNESLRVDVSIADILSHSSLLREISFLHPLDTLLPPDYNTLTLYYDDRRDLTWQTVVQQVNHSDRDREATSNLPQQVTQYTTVHCLGWISRIIEFVDRSASDEISPLHFISQDVNPYSEPRQILHQKLVSEKQDLRRACVQFGRKRLLFLHHLLDRNEVSSSKSYDESDESDQGGTGDVFQSYAHYPLANAKADTNTNTNGDSDDSGSTSCSGNGKGTSGSPFPVWESLTLDPFRFDLQEEYCGDPVFCSHTKEFQRRLKAWQFPDDPNSYLGRYSVEERSCAKAKFLVFEPPSEAHGIGSLLEVTAAALRYAICLDRILVLNPIGQEQTFSKWSHSGCRGNMMDCYFQDISGCYLTPGEIQAAHAARNESEGNYDAYPLKHRRVISMLGLPIKGPCALCYDDWPITSTFLDGLHVIGKRGKFTALDHRTKDMLHFSAFTTQTKITYMSNMLRFVMRPRLWFAQTIKQIVQFRMYSPSASANASSSELHFSTSGDGTCSNRNYDSSRSLVRFPQTFTSLHVRYGMKSSEQALQPLSKYMTVIRKKLQYTTDIFLSTETDNVVRELILNYPQYKFHILRYNRTDSLDLGLIARPTHSNYAKFNIDFSLEWMFSLANLYVAAAGSGFVGTLTSNWCVMIHHLERTRGDGGYDYYSVDRGSAFSSCF